MSGPKFGEVFSTTAKVLMSLFLVAVGIGVVYSIFEAITTETTGNKYLFAAYAVTWIIHSVYLGTIVRRYSRLKREIEELKK